MSNVEDVDGVFEADGVEIDKEVSTDKWGDASIEDNLQDKSLRLPFLRSGLHPVITCRKS